VQSGDVEPKCFPVADDDQPSLGEDLIEGAHQEFKFVEEDKGRMH
jgi:hypothetical protein